MNTQEYAPSVRHHIGTGREQAVLDGDKYIKMNRCSATVANALKKGLLIRPELCLRCNDNLFIEGHHEDYDKPLDVLWLCRDCHSLLHHPNRRYTNQRVTSPESHRTGY